MNSSSLHIAFCVNDTYVEYICVTIKSILDNNKTLPLHFHILIDQISKKSEIRLNSLFKDVKDKFLLIHLINDTPLKSLKFGKFTIYAWYRILLPNVLLNIDKVLYLDADTLVVGDLNFLYNLDLTKTSVAGVRDIGEEEHNTRLNLDNSICSGILLLNLDYWRKNNLTKKIIDWALENESILEFPDQDAINYICQDSKTLLPLKYGVIPSIFTRKYFLENYPEEILDAYHNPVIIHYAGKHLQPWMMKSSYFNVNLWRDINRKLKHPAKIIYEGNWLTKLKVRIWDKFHDRTTPMRDQIEKNIKSLKESYNPHKFNHD